MKPSGQTPVLRRPLALVGLMGVGKTTIGRRLARRLGAQFRDTDEAMQEAAGRTVAEIFSDFGEPAFREGEHKVIARLLKEPAPLVIGLGGGAFINDRTRALVRLCAISIWLRADLDVMVERVARRPDQRPLLAQGDARVILEKLEKERAPIYAEADIIVDSGESALEDCVERVITALHRYLKGTSL